MTEESTYIPIFAGRSLDYEKIVIYKHIAHPEGLYIQLSDGDLQALGAEYKLKMWNDEEFVFTYITIESPQWSGKVRGSMVELREAEEEMKP
jgi:hypothetical protein